MKNKLFRLYRLFINITALVYFIFDEVFLFLSSKLNALIRTIPRLEDILVPVNSWLKNQHKYVLLSLFVVLLAISELIGVFAFWNLSVGSISLFIVLYLVKFLPFFVCSYIFKETKETLLQISWFDFCYNKFSIFVEYLKSTEIAIKLKELKIEIKLFLKRFLDV